jgi:hypothetical protein
MGNRPLDLRQYLSKEKPDTITAAPAIIGGKALEKKLMKSG